MIAFLQEWFIQLIFGVLSIISALVIKWIYGRKLHKLERKEEIFMYTTVKLMVKAPKWICELLTDGKISITDLCVLGINQYTDKGIRIDLIPDGSSEKGEEHAQSFTK